MKKSTAIMLAFVLGQGVQIVCHAVALNLWEYRQIPFCLAAGFLVAVAVFAGVNIARGDEGKPMTYLDFARGGKH